MMTDAFRGYEYIETPWQEITSRDLFLTAQLTVAQFFLDLCGQVAALLFSNIFVLIRRSARQCVEWRRHLYPFRSSIHKTSKIFLEVVFKY